jgi:hypothetical protein
MLISRAAANRLLTWPYAERVRVRRCRTPPDMQHLAALPDIQAISPRCRARRLWSVLHYPHSFRGNAALTKITGRTGCPIRGAQEKCEPAPETSLRLMVMMLLMGAGGFCGG